ncbi:hypothetical protein PVK62_09575 [Aliivibrio sp. S3MY1]|uniref:hypothetical protein n=1 Tax=unclassified Aliivibrio TaxID=2645654 RepID=UPI002378C0A9|nr:MULTISPECIES: hypothetical protein [unclassified Aliivibrio]MDD9196080.1 hypothetical protein [Aliivibrio sp. S3MY1]MDD9199253.1 hypothetical protein [Aliivibrio sp. S2MY1]
MERISLPLQTADTMLSQTLNVSEILDTITAVSEQTMAELTSQINTIKVSL